ncbi:MAG: RNA polymerase sigma factor [Minisyncoccales bacterium]
MEKELIERYLKGEKEALESLICLYLKPIFSFVFHYLQNQQDAEDLTQEIFLKMWKNLKKFKKEENFKNWLFAIARNSCLDFLRKKKKDFLLLEKDFLFIDKNPLGDEIFERESFREKIEKEIKKLPFKMRKVLDFYYFLGLNFREISEILKEPINTIKSRHRRALLRLKKNIKD